MTIMPELNEGERYAGIILNKYGTPSHHLVLLQSEAVLNWDDAMTWAISISGDLPTPKEQALLFANCKDAFAPNWYWSSEQHANNSALAYSQYFDDGFQDISTKVRKGYARAVRRVSIGVTKMTAPTLISTRWRLRRWLLRRESGSTGTAI